MCFSSSVVSHTHKWGLQLQSTSWSFVVGAVDMSHERHRLALIKSQGGKKFLHVCKHSNYTIPPQHFGHYRPTPVDLFIRRSYEGR